MAFMGNQYGSNLMFQGSPQNQLLQIDLIGNTNLTDKKNVNNFTQSKQFNQIEPNNDEKSKLKLISLDNKDEESSEYENSSLENEQKELPQQSNRMSVSFMIGKDIPILNIKDKS